MRFWGIASLALCQALCLSLLATPAEAQRVPPGLGPMYQRKQNPQMYFPRNSGIAVPYSNGGSYYGDLGGGYGANSYDPGYYGPGYYGPGYYGPGAYSPGYYGPGYYGPGYYGPGYFGPGYSAPVLPYGWNGATGPYSVYGPLVLPTDALFGVGALPQLAQPGALQPAMNIPQAGNAQPTIPAANANVNPNANSILNGRQPPNAAGVQNVPREANPQTLDLAWKYLGFGDRHFAGQRYSDAYQRYQSALLAAPGLADVHYRRAFVLTALRRYDQAASAFAQGLALNAQWPRQFQLDQLYHDQVLAKQARLKSLADEAAASPLDADLQFLTGLHYATDGQLDAARPYLERSVQLGGDETRVASLLPAAPAPAANAQPAPAANAQPANVPAAAGPALPVPAGIPGPRKAALEF